MPFDSDAQRKGFYGNNNSNLPPLTITDILIESPDVIKKRASQMSYHEISDLTARLDESTAKMIRQNNKTSDELYDMGVLPEKPKPSDPFYNPSFRNNYDETINHNIAQRKILEHYARKKFGG